MADFSFFWHDYETFGRVPRRDRPVQFAGIRTDAGLNEIGEAVSLFCQPSPDYLPDPESVLLTGILPQQALHQGVAETEFAAAVERELARPGTVGVGYNSIRFDDEVTRFLFWRNLIDPYAREWQNECGRWDLLDTVRCAWALRPDGVQWPRQDDGRPSFRLEHLTAANGLRHESAHDALSDVRATVDLARLLRRAQPRLWDFCLKLRSKDAVRAEMGVNRPFAHLSGMYPAERGCLAVVWPLAPHPTNRNEVIVWDLAHDPGELAMLDVETLRRRMFTRSDELPEGEQRLPIKTIHVNKSPIVIGNLRTVDGAAKRFGLDVEQALRHAEAAAALAPSLAGIWPAVFQRPAAAEPVDVDEDLYNGFISNDDRRSLQRLREAGATAATRRPSFDDSRIDELLFRWLARNFPQVLDDGQRQRWKQHCADRLLRGSGGAQTLPAFLERVDELADAAAEREDARAQQLLDALYDYAQGIAPEDDLA